MERMFFGVALPPQVQEGLREIQERLRQHGVQAGNWTNAGLFHITVVFLGEVDTLHLNDVHAAGQRTAASLQPFRLSVGGVGTFARNRILWGDLVRNEGYSALVGLAQATEQELQVTTWALREEHPYRPHITLARKWTPTTSGTVSLPMLNLPESVQDWPVEDLCLFSSTRVNGKLAYPVREYYRLGS